MEKELYNQSEKEEFMNTLENEDVKRVYYHLFLKARGAEKFHQKDLYSFSVQQIEDVMKNVNPSTMNSAGNAKSRINNYITWAITNGRRLNNINPIHGLGRDWESKFIDKNAKRHFSEMELNELVDDLYNAQDQALIQCVFEGIHGQGFSELISMNYKNIDFLNNKVTVYDKRDNKIRTLEVSNRCMKFIENAYQQQTYISEKSANEKELIEFQDSVFKNTQWRSTKYEAVKKSTLSKRIYAIKEKYELEQFTVKVIKESGMLKMAADIYEERGVLGKEELNLIGDRFNLPLVKINGYEYHDVTKMREVINSKNLKHLYDIEVEV